MELDQPTFGGVSIVALPGIFQDSRTPNGFTWLSPADHTTTVLTETFDAAKRFQHRNLHIGVRNDRAACYSDCWLVVHIIWSNTTSNGNSTIRTNKS